MPSITIKSIFHIYLNDWGKITIVCGDVARNCYAFHELPNDMKFRTKPSGIPLLLMSELPQSSVRGRY
jgi:hypothetical protein